MSCGRCSVCLFVRRGIRFQESGSKHQFIDFLAFITHRRGESPAWHRRLASFSATPAHGRTIESDSPPVLDFCPDRHARPVLN